MGWCQTKPMILWIAFLSLVQPSLLWVVIYKGSLHGVAIDLHISLWAATITMQNWQLNAKALERRTGLGPDPIIISGWDRSNWTSPSCKSRRGVSRNSGFNIAEVSKIVVGTISISQVMLSRRGFPWIQMQVHLVVALGFLWVGVLGLDETMATLVVVNMISAFVAVCWVAFKKGSLIQVC